MVHKNNSKVKNLEHVYNFERQEEPTTLISTLLLRMRPVYVASISLDFPTTNVWNVRNAI